MPNWCWNRVNIKAKHSVLKTIKKKLRSENQEFDFNNLISNEKTKEESFKKWKTLSKAEIERWRDFETYWFNDVGYGWQIKNWGCKWNASHISKPTLELNELDYTFDTPWNPPFNIILKLIETFPNAEINWFYSEPGNGVGGKIIGEKGEIVMRETYELEYLPCPNCESYEEILIHPDKNEEDKPQQCVNCGKSFTIAQARKAEEGAP